MLENGKNIAARDREAERAAGEQKGQASRLPERPDAELVERARRRQSTAEYKLRIVRKADACADPGEIGALLRREGLYSSHLAAWRKQREEGALVALGKRRGRPRPDPLQAENAQLRRRLERTEADLAKARKVIEVQGNVSALLGELLEPRSAKEDEPEGGER
jgi:transposase